VIDAVGSRVTIRGASLACARVTFDGTPAFAVRAADDVVVIEQQHGELFFAAESRCGAGAGPCRLAGDELIDLGPVRAASISIGMQDRGGELVATTDGAGHLVLTITP
jgi:hypothetical protein